MNPKTPKTNLCFPALVMRQPDGSCLVVPGKPSVRESFSAVEVAKIVGLSIRRIQAMCRTGEIKAHQPSGKKGKYWIPLAEVVRMRGTDGI